ncbi:MAG: type II toxin-antitoxin system RelE/ParE family toxin, partial [Bdellovibrionales bacterium]
ERDLDEIHGYITQDNPAQADLIIDRLLTASSQLGQFPFLGRPGRIANTRELSVPRTSYIIIYTLPDAFHIDIETFVHTAKNYPDGT